jgi:hypothetical protein
MKPVNNKSLLHFLFDQMEKLDNGTIDINQANTQANLVRQANNLMRYELDKAKVLIQLSEHHNSSGKKIELRDVEVKNFD